MKIISLNKPVKGLIFDIDLTLYENQDYYLSQKTLLVKKLASVLKRPYEEVLKDVDHFQREFSEKNEGRKQSLGNIFLHFGIDIQTNVKWRNELFQPEEFLTHDQKLVDVFTRLSKDFTVIAVTNNTEEIGLRTLKVLGIETFFLKIIGLDTTGISKPSMVPFDRGAEFMKLPNSAIVSIGDRMAVDIELPVKAGMGGILIESIEDAYGLPEVLS